MIAVAEIQPIRLIYLPDANTYPPPMSWLPGVESHIVLEEAVAFIYDEGEGSIWSHGTQAEYQRYALDRFRREILDILKHTKVVTE